MQGKSQRARPRWSDQDVLVYGWGSSGRAVTELMASFGCRVVVVDEQSLPDIAESSAVAAFRLDQTSPEKLLDGISLLVLSPGVPLSRPLVQSAHEAGIEVRGELEIAADVVDDAADLVAITGSNGKSTTTELTGALLRSAGLRVEVCGNIGVPLSECVLRDEVDVFVVEVSSFQLETVDRLRPKVAALLNLSDDHLDRHGSFEVYADTKRRLFACQEAGDVAVLNADDARVASTELPPEVRRRFFSRLELAVDGASIDRANGPRSDGDAIVVLRPETTRIVALRDLRLRGEHNTENVLAACAIADSVTGGRLRSSFEEALRDFRGLPHRLQEVASDRGVVFYDDSKGTNVGATLKSIAGFASGSVHLILGGRSKGSDFSPLLEPVADRAAAVYLIGEAAAELETLLAERVPTHRCESLQAAVASAFTNAREGQVVVLSPACASFDQFRNYVHRGEVFAAAVTQEIAARGAAPPATGLGGEVDVG